MEIFFQDPDDIPLPPAQLRVREFEAKPYPDKRRVRVYLELTPFQVGPDAEIDILNAQSEQVAGVSIVETISPKMELTLHLREPAPGGTYTARVRVFYRETKPEGDDTQASPLAVSEGSPPVMVVDEKIFHFQIQVSPTD